MTWRLSAKCVDLALEERLMFFGDSSYPVTAQTQYKQARLVCYECPVQVECLLSAIDNKERTGVWGGLTESQRRRHAIPRIKVVGREHEVIVSLLEELRPETVGSTPDSHRNAPHARERYPIRQPVLSETEAPIPLAVG